MEMEEKPGIVQGATAGQGANDSSCPLQNVPEPPFSGPGASQLPEELPPWDGADVFLSSFELLAHVCRWPPGELVAHLLQALKGDTQQALGRLEARDREDYRKVKAAILQMEVPHQERFQRFRSQESHGPQGADTWLQELCCLWYNIEKRTMEKILWNFLALLPADLQTWVRDAGPETCSQAAALVQDYLRSQPEAPRQTPQMLEEEIVSLCDSDRLCETDWSLLNLGAPAEEVVGGTERYMNIRQEENRTPQSLELSVATAGGNVPRSQEQVFGGQHRLGQLLETQRENVGGRVSSGGGNEGERGTAQQIHADLGQVSGRAENPHQGRPREQNLLSESPAEGEGYPGTPTELFPLLSGPVPNTLGQPAEYFNPPREHLESRRETHKTHKLYRCAVCGKTFAWSTSLSKHKKCHTRGNL